MFTHSSPVCFRSHEIGGEPIAINRAQILISTKNFIEKPSNTFLDLGFEPKTSSVAVALKTARLIRQSRYEIKF